MHYKRKGHRGRSKKQGRENNNCRAAGNSGQNWQNMSAFKGAHGSRSVRNRVDA